MNTLGRHLIVEYHGCDPVVLDDMERIERSMRQAARAAGAAIVASVFHPFSPQGVTGVVVVEESHLSIHTWPELGYAAVDFYTCGDCTPKRAHDILVRALEPRRSERLELARGLGHEGGSIRVLEHRHWDGSQSGDDEDLAACDADPFRPWISAAPAGVSVWA